MTIFLSCNTQWRHSFGGIAGLDYTAVIAVLGLYESMAKKQRLILDDIRALERGALQVFNEQQEKKAR